MCTFKKEEKGKLIDCYFSKLDCFITNFDLDELGFCIFHSQNKRWKNENNFSIQLKNLLDYFENETSEKEIFLEDVIFIGDSIQLFNNNKFRKDINLKNSEFRDDVTISSTFFKNLNLASSIFYKTVTFSDLSLKKVTFDNVSFESYFSITDCEFHLDFFMLNTKFNGGVSIVNSYFNSNAFFQGIRTNIDKSINQGVIFKNIQFKDFTTFELSEFNSVVDFKKITIHKELNFHNTQFNYDEPLPMISSVSFEEIIIKENGRVEFRGDSDNKMFSKVQEVSFYKEKVDGKLVFEHTDFNKFIKSSKENLIKDSLDGNSKVIIGKGCIKYYNRTPLKSIEIDDDNQNLLIELCNTFVDYFMKNGGFNLGVEFVSRTKQKINFFYFSDEIIPYDVFETKLQKSEQQMWHLIKIENDNLEAEPPKNCIPSKIINATDTMVNLFSLVLKIGSRIPLGLISKEEISQLLSTTLTSLPSNKQPNNGLIINQIVLFGSKNQQSLQVKKIGL